MSYSVSAGRVIATFLFGIAALSASPVPARAQEHPTPSAHCTGALTENFRHAERLHLRALSIIEKLEPLDRDDLARQLLGLADLRAGSGCSRAARASAERAASLLDADPRSAPGTRTEAHLLLARVLADLGHAAAAGRHLDIALSLQPDAGTHGAVPALLAQLGRLSLGSGNLEQAETHFRRALSLTRAMPAVPADVNAEIHGALAELYSAQGRVADAFDAHSKLFLARKAHYGPDHPSTIQALVDIAGDRRKLGDAAGAQALLQRAVSQLDGMAEPASRVHADALTALAELVAESGQRDRAFHLLNRAVPILGSLPDTQAELAYVHQTLAQLHAVAGRPHEAAAAASEAARLYVTAPSPSPGASLYALATVADSHVDTGDLASARRVLDEALAILAHSAMAAEERVPQLLSLAESNVRAERPAVALTLYGQALSLYDGEGSRDAETLLRALDGMIWLVMPDDPQRAFALAERATAVRAASRPDDSGVLASSMSAAAMAASSAGHKDVAETRFRRALAILDEGRQPNPQAADLASQLGWLLYDRKAYDEALAVFGKAAEIRGAVSGATHPDTIRLRSAQALVLEVTRRHYDAIVLLNTLVREAELLLGPGHSEVVTLRAALSRNLSAF